MDSFILKMGRKAGIGLHFTSLPGAHGCGDIADAAHRFIDSLAKMGIGVWQFLPTGPTTIGNSPYQPLSTFAGNPMLIGLDHLARLDLLGSSELAAPEALPQASVDYDRVIPLRAALLSRACQRFRSRRFPSLKTAYEEFLHCHDTPWLHDFALFQTLRSAHQEQGWLLWEKEFRRRDPAALRAFAANCGEAIDQIKFIQFLFDLQWRELKCHAAENGVLLFGDMPIYIPLDSADAWAQPELLMLDDDGRPARVAGVPPDYFSAEGQLWGNPVYDWSYHRETGYRWWVGRMRHALDQAQLLRIDHFRGFESYWSVAADEATARNGRWEPGPGDALFSTLRQSLGELPIVAEDLGVITPEVTALRLRHGIPGMRVLQFEVADPDFDLEDIEQNCVCYTGTHDNDTTAGWFEGKGADTRSAGEVAQTRMHLLRLTGGSRQTIHLDLIRLAFASRAALAIAPMQDYLGLGSEARLNIPGTEHGNWRWRMAPDALSQALAAQVAELTRGAGRFGPVKLCGTIGT